MFYEQVKDLGLEPFKRLTGVKPETCAVMVRAFRVAASKKRKSGRPSKLLIEDQLLILKLSFVIVDVTETPVERPKKSSSATTAGKRSATR